MTTTPSVGQGNNGLNLRHTYSSRQGLCMTMPNSSTDQDIIYHINSPYTINDYKMANKTPPTGDYDYC